MEQDDINKNEITDETDEFEVMVEDEPTLAALSPSKQPAKPSYTRDISAENTKHTTRKWWLIILIITPLGYYFLSNGQLFGNSLSENRAKGILVKMMEIRSEKQFDRISEVFTDPTEKYFGENDISRKNIVSDMEKFAETWTFEDVKIVDFGRTVENMFHFTITYTLRDKKNLQITPYRINGEVGFIKENEQYKINYITNRGVTSNRSSFNYSVIPVHKQQDFNDYYLTYNASLLYLPDVKDNYLLNYIYSDLLDVQPAGYNKEQLQKTLQDDYIEFINTAEKQMKETWADTAMIFSKQIEMTTAFVDANFLSIQVVKNTTYGRPVKNFYVQYKNVDYTDGRVLALNNVIDTNAVPWSELIQKAFGNRAVSAGGKIISEENISTFPNAPNSFYFDTKKIFFVYGAEEIPEAAFLGTITVSVPLSDVENYLTNYFREKIFNSGKVNVKKI